MPAIFKVKLEAKRTVKDIEDGYFPGTKRQSNPRDNLGKKRDLFEASVEAIWSFVKLMQKLVMTQG